MDKLWMKEKHISDIDDQLYQAHEIMMRLKHSLEAHKESYRKTVKRGDIKPVNDPTHKVTITQEELTKLIQLGQALINPSLVEREAEG